jgi:hypothetical protein
MSIHSNMVTSIDELRAAAYLNNSAVSLIQTRRSDLKGMKTLSDAISIIKGAPSLQASSQGLVPPAQNERFDAIQQKLQNAAQLLSNPEHSPDQKPTKIAVLSDQQRPTCSLANDTYLIRIDSSDFDAATSAIDLAVTTSIIFYNQAIACRSLSSLFPTACSAKTRLEGRAMRLFHLASSASGSSAAPSEPARGVPPHIVNLLILRNLVELSQQGGERTANNKQQNEYATCLANLCQAIRKLEAIERKLPAPPAAAA